MWDEGTLFSIVPFLMKDLLTSCLVVFPPMDGSFVKPLSHSISAQIGVCLTIVVSTVCVVVIGRIENVVELLVRADAIAVLMPVRTLCKLGMVFQLPCARTC